MQSIFEKSNYFLNKKQHSKFIKYNFILNRHLNFEGVYHKYRLNLQDKLFYYYNIKTTISLFTHKAFILFETQLNMLLIKTKLIPYLHIATDLCYYRLVFINNTPISNSHYIVGIYDLIQIPYFLHQQFFYRQFQMFLIPKYLRKFFKYYWKVLADYSSNKVWIINNYITSSFTAQTLLFEYPNINLYQAPFRRFTKIYYQSHPFAANSKLKYSANTFNIIKLKLFEYSQFYH